ncbi:MAG: hypothetical protein Q8920_10730 [Bacillota bacterium]|nr:hypothetical protein [Bacillota bacterium]
MEYIRKLPFLLGAVMSIIVGLLSYSGTGNNQQVFIKMAISMIVFYIIGIFIKNVVISYNRNMEEKRRQEELLERERLMEEERIRIEEEEKAKSQEKNNRKSKIDIKVEDNDGDFVPLNFGTSKNDDGNAPD